MIDWARFNDLSGAVTANFEKLCRGVVRRHFGYLGALHELKNQPGVEYYVTLNEDHTRLGKLGETVGWQCKWFEYRANGDLTATAIRQIEHSLDKTLEHLPNLKHWILWTHKALSAGDQRWFYGLSDKYGFELQLWNESDLDELLSGLALDLRHSFFGSLALTENMLAKQHEESIAPIKGRWLHDVHQCTEIERQVRMILGEPRAWETTGLQLSLLSSAEVIRTTAIESEYSPWSDELIKLADACQAFADSCGLFAKPIAGTDIHLIKELAKTPSTLDGILIRKVLSKLRSNNLPLSLYVTNALAYLKDTRKLFAEAESLFSKQCIAIVADAGGGKTQFSAEITASNEGRPAGILLLGRNLRNGFNLDNLAQQIFFYYEPVSCFKALVAAIDAVGERSGCRLPIVIDGLNEAEDPRLWCSLLEGVRTYIDDFPNVVLICTLRTGERARQAHGHLNNGLESREFFAKQSIPEMFYQLQSTGFEGVTLGAIHRYFEYYHIDAEPFAAPIEFFNHPLNLKIFCEVTNRHRTDKVQVTYFPSSLSSLFLLQIEHSAETIAGLTNLKIRYIKEDLLHAVYILGELLWESGSRKVSESDFIRKWPRPVDDWDSNIINLLAQEGLIFRDEDEPYQYILRPSYDLLGGYLVASYLLKKNHRVEFQEWIQSIDFIDLIFGNINDQHELSHDILSSLIALSPKNRPEQQVWKVVPAQFRNQVLSRSHLIDRGDFCSETVTEYKAFLLSDKLTHESFETLRQIRTVVGHPLNADFFTSILMELSLVERDISWTEHNRIHHRERIKSLNNLIEHWSSQRFRGPEVERLRAVWVSWLLTSTCLELRDLATEALYRYGLHKPEGLFAITLSFFSVNDFYVCERLLAASYAVATVLTRQNRAIETVSRFAQDLYQNIFSDTAPYPTTHLLARDYASSTILLVNKHITSVISAEQLIRASTPYEKMPRRKWEEEVVNGEASWRHNSPLGMDFENYTIGRLVSGRGNYDFDHPEYRQVRGKILWRVKQLGWSEDLFSKIDNRISSEGNHSRGSRPRIERYGKKYSWIAYYEMAGQLDDEGRLKIRGKRFAADIDPFFAISAKESDKVKSYYLGSTEQSTDDWILNSDDRCCEPRFILNEAEGTLGSWVLLNASFSEQSKRLDREFYCRVQSVFVNTDAAVKLDECLVKHDVSKLDGLDISESHHLYIGELYWHNLACFEDGQDLRVITGFTNETIERPSVVINGKQFLSRNRASYDIPIYENFPALLPVINYHWGTSNVSRHNFNQVLLSPWLVDSLGLSFDPLTISYYDNEGQKAIMFSEQKGETSGNYEQLAYLRKDLFEQLLESNNLKLFWIVGGERQLEKTDHLHVNPSMAHKNFRWVKKYGGHS